MKLKVYQQISRSLFALQNSIAANNTEWQSRHEETIQQIIKSTAPSGGGIDCGTVIDLDKSKPDKLVLICEFHHMDENGFYDGWTRHNIIVTPALGFDFDLRMTGCNRNQIKDYLTDIYSDWLNETLVHGRGEFTLERWQQCREPEYAI